MPEQLTLAFAADHAGFLMKGELIKYAQELGHASLDFGTDGFNPIDYPDIVPPVVEAVSSGKARFGILLCGTGIGVDIAANRHPGIRAALCSCGFVAQTARWHNDANILCLGTRIIGSTLARDCFLKFITSDFKGGRHTQRVKKLG